MNLPRVAIEDEGRVQQMAFEWPDPEIGGQ